MILRCQMKPPLLQIGLLSTRCPRGEFLSAASSICKPPNMMTNLSSPYCSGQYHWICFATAYVGWSAAMKGTCPGFKNATVSLILSITCLIVATEWAWSRRRGSRAVMLTSNWALFSWMRGGLTMWHLLHHPLLQWRRLSPATHIPVPAVASGNQCQARSALQLWEGKDSSFWRMQGGGYWYWNREALGLSLFSCVQVEVAHASHLHCLWLGAET